MIAKQPEFVPARAHHWPGKGSRLCALVLLLLSASMALAQPADGPPADTAKPATPATSEGKEVAAAEHTPAILPLARFLVVDSPIDDAVFRTIRNTALSLQELAVQEKRPAILFLEIRPGQSEFHQAYGLAQFLSSSKLNQITTVAWISENVTGNNVVVALGCREIVMHPDALLGDIGRGKAVDASEEQAVLSLIDKRHNLQISHDLAVGMLNPEATLIQLTIQREGTSEKRVVTEEQAKVLRENQIAIVDAEVIKDKRKPGLFSGQHARELGFLVTHTASQQAELAELYHLDPQALKAHSGPGESTRIRLIEITNTIDPILESFLDRQIDRALKEGAQTLIFQIKSPGGYLISGTNIANRIADLEERRIRTIAWIPEQALSSAAILALGCDEIYLGPNGQIGDAGVIRQQFDGAFERVPEKVISPLLQTLRALAQRKHRPPALLEAMTLKDLEVFQVRHRETGRVWFMSEAELVDSTEWIKGALVPESASGLLLTLHGNRAVELKIAVGVVKNQDELKERLNIPADVVLRPIERSWVDALVYLLNDPFVTGCLFFIAIMCIYIELHFMIGIFGIMSALCFGIFFWSRYCGGTATGLEILLFLIGVTCILLEVAVIPGFGVFGVTGGLLVLLSLVLATERFQDVETQMNSQKLIQAISVVGLPLLAVIASSAIIGKYLPQIPLLKHIVLIPPNSTPGNSTSPQLRPDLVNQAQNPFYPGRQGRSLTTLRPAGKAKFDDQVIDVVTEGPFIEPEIAIEIVEARGNRIVVREWQDA